MYSKLNMEVKSTTFSRQQLYDLVWETPITMLAIAYLISAHGLRETCKAMAIPLPDSGYWSKRKAGKATSRKPLTQDYTGEQQFTVPLRPADGSGIEIDASPEVRIQKELEQNSSLDFTVPAQLINPVPLVAEAAKVLTSKKAHAYDGLMYTGRGLLSIQVSLNSVDRALCFMDALIKLLEQRGFSIRVTEQASHLVVNGKNTDMVLREVRRQESVLEGRWNRIVYYPTGKLTLEIKHALGGITCSDGTLLLEKQLPKILAKVEVMSQRLREWYIESEKQQSAYEEKQRNERELTERKRIEVSLFKNSLADARCWREAQSFREYISQIKARAIAMDALTDELKAWIDWANRKADWLDPLVNSPDALLDGHEPSSLLPLSYSSADLAPTNQYNYSSSDEKHNWPLLPWYTKK